MNLNCYNIGDDAAPNRVDVLTVVDGVRFEDAWRDRASVEIEGLRIPVISRAHLILNGRTASGLLDADLLDSPTSHGEGTSDE